MTEKQQEQTGAAQTNQAVEIEDAKLEQAQGGAIYMKVDGVAGSTKGIKDGTSN